MSNQEPMSNDLKLRESMQTFQNIEKIKEENGIGEKYLKDIFSNFFSLVFHFESSGQYLVRKYHTQ